MKAKATVITGFGINADYELEHGLKIAGAEPERIHLNKIIENKPLLENSHILAFPGGFSFGDDIASGKVLANKTKFNLLEPLRKFIKDGKLIIGICNGFQAITKLGLLPAFEGEYGNQQATLTFNDSGRFEDRWTYLKQSSNSKCIWTKGADFIYLPVRHGEGKFYMRDEEELKKLFSSGQAVYKYTDEKGNTEAGYPYNPNGSSMDIAGICDETGRVFGLMPHPEAFLMKYNHPRWTREQVPETIVGTQIFQNAVNYIKENF